MTRQCDYSGEICSVSGARGLEMICNVIVFLHVIVTVFIQRLTLSLSSRERVVWTSGGNSPKMAA